MKSMRLFRHFAGICAFLAVLSVSHGLSAQVQPVGFSQQVSLPFRFVAYSDTRFTSPRDSEASNPVVRRTLVQAIADVHPAFISIGGDIVYRGFDINDWKEFVAETAIWREQAIPVYPAIGNHELRGDLKTALGNYFSTFPELKQNQYYSVRVANTLMLVLNSALDEVSGPQGQWLKGKLHDITADVDFVFLVMHHPPYTSSSESFIGSGGHSARHSEQAMAQMLEAEQKKMRARIVVFSGHVHNYERHEHGGVTYFVSGGGGAHAYPIQRGADDPFQSREVNYHYLLVSVDRQQIAVTMNRLQIQNGQAKWTQPDSVLIRPPIAVQAAGVGK